VSLHVIDIRSSFPRKTRPRQRPDSAIRRIVVHHDAAPPPKDGAEVGCLLAYHKEHQAKRWGGIGYHYAIARRGTVYKLNPATSVTAHARGGSRDGLGVMLMGDFTHHPPSQAQLESLTALAAELVLNYKNITAMVGHRRVSGSRTACPGDSFTDAMIAACWPA